MEDDFTILNIIEEKKKRKGLDTRWKNLTQKKASAYYFVYVGAFLIASITLYIIFGQIIQQYLQPKALDFQDASDIAESNKFIGFWNLIPYILVPAMILFLFIRTGESSRYG